MGRVVSRRKIEMSWRCSACSTRNLGRYKECQHCGDPKDSSEKYEMPSNTAAAATVTDSKLLTMAKAGPNWRCHYCGSHQRALDGTCAQCGAAQEEGKSVRSRQNTPGPIELPARLLENRSALVRAGAIIGSIVLTATMLLCVSGYWLTRPVDKDASVTSVHWEHLVHVERYAVRQKEGFSESIPSGAFDQTSLGQRHHHDVQVLDGYDTEHYTEDVPCGEDCYSTPESCSESCTADDNGFASCTTSCSGGGQTCTTRYCSESRTRQVARYRTEPVYAEFFSFKLWEWAPQRTVPARGDTVNTRWPSEEEIAEGEDLAEGERERSRRETSYEVTFAAVEDGQQHVYHPTTAEELERFPPGTDQRIRVFYDEHVELIGPEDE